MRVLGRIPIEQLRPSLLMGGIRLGKLERDRVDHPLCALQRLINPTHVCALRMLAATEQRKPVRAVSVLRGIRICSLDRLFLIQSHGLPEGCGRELTWLV